MGISIQRKLCDRVHILQELIDFLQELKAEIVFRAAPIRGILSKFAGKEKALDFGFLILYNKT